MPSAVGAVRVEMQQSQALPRILPDSLVWLVTDLYDQLAEIFPAEQAIE